MNKEFTLGEKSYSLNPKYKWIAMDQDGCWWAFTLRPYILHNRSWFNEKGEKIWLGFNDYKPENWKNTLRKI